MYCKGVPTTRFRSSGTQQKECAVSRKSLVVLVCLLALLSPLSALAAPASPSDGEAGVEDGRSAVWSWLVELAEMVMSWVGPDGARPAAESGSSDGEGGDDQAGGYGSAPDPLG